MARWALSCSNFKLPGNEVPSEVERDIESRIDASAGLYNSSGEYIRDLVRRDYEAEEARKWAWLRSELKTGLAADPSEFKALDAESILQKAKLG